MKWLIFFIVGAISLPFLWTGIAEIKNTIIKQKTTKKVQATVVGHTKNVAAGGVIYFAELEFKLPDGTMCKFTDPVGTFPADYQTGEHVWVYYNPHQPHDATISSFKRTYLVPLIFILIGLLPPLIFLLMLKKLGF